jgi:hypothetical protein
MHYTRMNLPASTFFAACRSAALILFKELREASIPNMKKIFDRFSLRVFEHFSGNGCDRLCLDKLLEMITVKLIPTVET